VTSKHEPDNHPRDAIDRIGETLQQIHNRSLLHLDSLGKRTIQAFRDHEIEVQAIATAPRERLTMRQALKKFLAANTNRRHEARYLRRHRSLATLFRRLRICPDAKSRCRSGLWRQI
jgi:hypothetical protein